MSYLYELGNLIFPPFLLNSFSLHCHPDIEREKAEQKLFQGISSFDKSAMRQVSTEEKILLPTQAGNICHGVLWLKMLSDFSAHKDALLSSASSQAKMLPQTLHLSRK